MNQGAQGTQKRCHVDHEERRQMGSLRCYWCGDDIATIEEANDIRVQAGKEYLFGADRVLHKATEKCPMCNGSGVIQSEAPR